MILLKRYAVIVGLLCTSVLLATSPAEARKALDEFYARACAQGISNEIEEGSDRLVSCNFLFSEKQETEIKQVIAQAFLGELATGAKHSFTDVNGRTLELHFQGTRVKKEKVPLHKFRLAIKKLFQTCHQHAIYPEVRTLLRHYATYYTDTVLAQAGGEELERALFLLFNILVTEIEGTQYTFSRFRTQQEYTESIVRVEHAIEEERYDEENLDDFLKYDSSIMFRHYELLKNPAAYSPGIACTPTQVERVRAVIKRMAYIFTSKTIKEHLFKTYDLLLFSKLDAKNADHVLTALFHFLSINSEGGSLYAILAEENISTALSEEELNRFDVYFSALENSLENPTKETIYFAEPIETRIKLAEALVELIEKLMQESE